MDLSKFKKEYDHYLKLIKLIETDQKHQAMVAEAPGLIEHIRKYANIITEKIEICEWVA